jgi:hypothetical protein
MHPSCWSLRDCFISPDHASATVASPVCSALIAKRALVLWVVQPVRPNTLTHVTQVTDASKDICLQRLGISISSR